MNRLHVILAVLLVVLACFALSPQARAVCQEGCLTNGNTVLGDDTLLNNTGTNNTATGSGALSANTIGFANTANGMDALSSNTTGPGNTGLGADALSSNTTGSFNTAIGWDALVNNETGNSNTAIGQAALLSNIQGQHNTAIGFQALHTMSSGSFNIAVGSDAGSKLFAGQDNIDIGNLGKTGDNSTIRIGTRGRQTNTYIAGISGVTVADGVGVIVGADGHLGTVVSSERYKDDIKPMNKASEAILALKPVTFRYKHELDPQGIPQFGLVAEDVEKINPDLVARDEQGKPYTVRYEAVNAMLLNEFLKEHRKVEVLEKQVTALSAGLRKVTAQLEVNKSATQTASTNH